ncbi:TauD/TfdA family dioxygenase, partial [Listeria monocytogenes]
MSEVQHAAPSFSPASHAAPRPAAVPLQLRQVAGRIGAEIADVRLSATLDDATFDAIQAALLRHKVLFFRGQHHLD